MTVVEFPAKPMPANDAQARRDALDTTRSFIVEAPAGSGKTGLLIQRYLRLLTVVGQPESVLALTFTNKATAEMRHRVLSALEAAREPLPDTAKDYERETWTTARQVLDHDAALHWNLLAQPHRLNLRTIDSLCGEIARAVPVLSGGIGNATPVPDAVPLYRTAARTVLLQLGGPDAALNRALETVLHHRDADLADCETLLAGMLATREQWGTLVPLSRRELNDITLDREVLPRLNVALESVLCAALTDLREHFPDHLLQEVAAIAHLLSDADGYNDQPNPLRPCATMPYAPGTAADDVEHWKLLAHLLIAPSSGTWRKAFAVNHLGFKLTKIARTRLEHALEDLREDDQLLSLLHAVRALPPATYPADQWHVAKALFAVLHHALIELRLLFAAREVCDFTELSIVARTALEAGHSTTEALNLRLEHLLVDEMQDTSSAQYALLEALTAHWDGRTQTVFLVGDPKQSIYLFRQARVERFLAATRDELLGDIPLTPLKLSSNFRSGGALVEAFNTTFSTVFDPAGTIRYTAAAAALPPTADDTLAWNAIPADPADPKQSRREEAETIAAYAHHWRNKPLPPGRDKPWKIAVLVRNRTHAFEAMRKLAEANVPFRAVEMEELGERPEILDLLALTRALLHPADRTAWLAILRAPWCGLTLADLHTLAAGDQPTQRKQALRQHLRERTQHLTPEARTRALRTLDILDATLAHRSRNPLSVDVAETWSALQGDRTTDALGRTNARRFFELLEQMEASGESIEAASLKTRLARLYAEPASTPDAVEVLTIHKAKGLEWDAVLVPGLHRTGRADTAPLLDWMELPADSNGRAQVLLAPISKRGDDPDSLNRYLRKAHTEAASAELQRLFYVAATRARTALQLYASTATNQDGTITFKANTLLNAARTAAEPHFMQTPPAPAATLIAFPAIPLHAPGLALAASGTEEATSRDESTLDLGSLDGSDTASQREPILQRLPLHLLQTATVPAADPPTRHHARDIVRPQGSVAARVLGNTVHAFFQLLATSLQDSTQPPDTSTWPARIRAVVRGSGLSPRDAERVTADTLRALANTRNTPEAAWLFHPHRNARNEGELLAPSPTGPARFRFDRSFFAGPAALAPGDDTLWIIDYKTSTYREADHVGDTRDTFLARERATYQPHLENYARLMLRDLPASTPVMLALYYPLLPWLDVFPYTPA